VAHDLNKTFACRSFGAVELALDELARNQSPTCDIDIDVSRQRGAPAISSSKSSPSAVNKTSSSSVFDLTW